MTTGPIGKANSDYSIKLPNLLKTQAGDNAQAAGGVKKVTTVDMQPNKQIDRTDLDKLSPYSAMGLQLTQKPAVGTVESYAQAAPEFSGWQGNYTINNKQEAISYLKKQTNDWTNITERNIKIVDDNNKYKNVYENMRATLPTYTDISKIENQNFIYDNLKTEVGYWLSTSSSKSFYAWSVTNNEITTTDVSLENLGIRPVVTLYKY